MGAATDEKAERFSLPCLREVLQNYADGGLEEADVVRSDGRKMFEN